MSIIANNLLQGDEGYNISRSLRFRSSASAYLNRTPASAGNRRTFTWSGWVKRGSLSVSTDFALFSAYGSSDDSGYWNLRFRVDINTNCLAVGIWNNDQRNTTALYRDTSAWYHIVCAVDTTQATASNRTKLYVNGVQMTSFSIENNVAQNTDLAVNNTVSHKIGADYTGRFYLDGYLTEVNFIDGQQLTPSSFGETDLVTGVWKPKKYAGTYGTNGFYLDFKDNSSTAALGYDAAGSNDWTVNNISLTAGTTYDSMVDVPTMSALASNYCVLSPIDTYDNPPTEGNLRRTGVGHGGSPWSSCRGTLGVSSGKWYFEATLTGSTGSTGNNMVGIMTTATSTLSDAYGGAVSRSYQANGGMQGDNSTGTVSSASSGDVIMCAFDIDAGKVWFGKNGTWFNSGVPASGTGNVFTSVPTTPVVPALHMYGNTGDNYGWFTNFGQRPFSYTPPTGFVALNTYNLPTPTIGATASTRANKNFDVKLYTANNSTAQTITGLNFQPDFLWFKQRSRADQNALFDSIRGVGKYLISNLTVAEGTDATGLLSFNSDGFSLGTDGAQWLNYQSDSMVSWAWKAAGSTVSNTSGSITSTVSANTSAGFSVVGWTGTGSVGTLGHGLGVAPKMIIGKRRDGVSNWFVYHESLGNTKGMNLNTTDAASTNSGWWNNTSPTSSVFTMGSYETNNGSPFIAYCFSEIAGYSKFGSYTGNGSSDGTFVYTGFRPKFVMIKNSDYASGHWNMQDSSRGTYNVFEARLLANASNSEIDDGNGLIDFLSNGFKIRASHAGMNGSGNKIIFAAFAEVPTKFALAR